VLDLRARRTPADGVDIRLPRGLSTPPVGKNP
jgi:hypothetical protein